EFLRLLLLIALERREVDETSLAVVHRVREMALERVRRLITRLLGALGTDSASRLAAEFAPFFLCVADGAFVAQHIDPEVDLHQLFGLLGRSLTALAREIVASGDVEARR